MEYTSDRESKRPFSALYIKSFRLFWLAQILSLSGTWMHHISQGWLVYSLTRSPFYLGLTGAALTLPILLFSLLGGIIADRYQKRNVLLITQSLSILPPLILGVLTQMELVSVWHVITVAFVIGTINAIDMPVRQSFLIEMVGKGNLLNAIALSSAAFNGARMIGPIIAGFIISEISISACFYINSLSFIPVVMVLQKMRLKGDTRLSSQRSILSEFREGLRFVLKRRDISMILLTIFVFSLLGLPYSHFLPVFAEDILKVGPEGLGILMGSAGAGALAAALVISLLGEIRNKDRYMTLSALSFPSALLLFSFSRNYHFSILMLVLMGFSIVSYLANANSSIQLRVDHNIRGRVMSIYSLVFLGMVPIGSAILGVFAEMLGTPVILRISAIVCLFSGVLFGVQRYLSSGLKGP